MLERAAARRTALPCSIKFQGNIVKVSVHKDVFARSRDVKRTGRRGNVTTFSRASRKRLLDLFNSLDVKLARRATLITLTTREVLTPREFKRDFRALVERIRRRFSDRSDMSGVWRLEYQRRGAPHVHLIMFNMPYLQFSELRQMWGEIVNQPDVSVNIKLIKNHRQLMSYVSKYVAKNPDAPEGGAGSTLLDVGSYLHAEGVSDEETRQDGEAAEQESAGRVWGYYRRAALPFATLKVVEGDISYVALHTMKRAARKHYKRASRGQFSGFTLYCDSSQWFRYFMYCCAMHTAVAELVITDETGSITYKQRIKTSAGISYYIS